MAPAPPRTKFSKAIIQKAREWKTIVDELPLLEKFDDLESAIEASQRRLDSQSSVEAAARERLDDLQKQSQTLTEQAASLTTQLEALQAKLRSAEDQSRKAAEAEAAGIVATAREQASTVLQTAQRSAQEATQAGQAKIDEYRRSLDQEITSREARVAELKDEEARLVAAHASASAALEGLKSQLGVH